MDPNTFRLMMTSGVAVAPISQTYWIASIGANTEGYIVTGIKVDSSGNVYVNGSTDGSNQTFIAKFNASGTLQWQRTLADTSSPFDDVTSFGLAISTGGDIYLVGSLAPSGNSRLLIFKYDTDGVFQWQRTVGTSNDTKGFSIAVDSSNNAYVAGFTNSQGAGDYDGVIAKFDSSGNLQWQRALGSTQFNALYGIVLDSSANVHIVGDTSILGGADKVRIIAKYDTSGTLQWQYSLSSVGANMNTASTGIAVDSGGNVYVSGKRFASGTSDSFLAKYNSSGTLQWQTGLLNSSLSAVINYKIDVDSSGNVYATGTIGDAALVAKYNSSGTLQWQRRIISAVLPAQGYNIAVSSTGIIYVGGNVSEYDPIGGIDYIYAFVAKLPTDGSLTGTYGNITYEATTHTVYTPAETSAASTLTSTTTTLPDNTPTLTDASGTFSTATITL